MKQAFNEASSDNLAVVILSDENGLTPADEGTYRTLVDKLRADTAHVSTTQDFVHLPEVKQALTSTDNKAWQLPVNLTGVMGTGGGQEAYRNAVKIVRDTTANTTLTANVVGPAATFDDLTTIGAEGSAHHRDRHRGDGSDDSADRLSQRRRHAPATGHDRRFPGRGTAGGGGAGSRRPPSRTADPGADDRNDARRGNRLRRVPLQSLSRVRADGHVVRRCPGGRAQFDRRGGHGVGGHRRHHLLRSRVHRSRHLPDDRSGA